MSELTKDNNDFVGYEYKDITIRRNMESVYEDGYSNFGWVLNGTAESPKGMTYVTLKFKRDCKARTNGELNRLQRQFDGCVAEIIMLERSKVLIASTVAYVIGIIGSAFIAGSTFAYNAGSLSLSTILAVPGFVGWIIPYLCFRAIVKKKSARVTPLIDQKYDEIYNLGKKGSLLLK